MPTEPHWLEVLALLVAGFVLLAKGAGWLVEGSALVARRMGISLLVVGLTVVAFGTSAPEVVVSALAAWQGNSDISLGNVLGSNVANIGLVLGSCAIVLPAVLETPLLARERAWLFASLALLWWVCRDRAVDRPDAALLLGCFLLYNAHVIYTARSAKDQEVELPEETSRPWLSIALGVVGVALGAKLVVDGATGGAYKLGVPDSVIALTLVALGTSLPELAAGLSAAFKGEKDISLGNVVGSNVFNLIAVIGIVGLIQPLDPEHERIADPEALRTTFDKAMSEDFFVVLGFSIAAVMLPFLGGSKAGRTKGALLVLAYLAYNGWLFVSR